MTQNELKKELQMNLPEPPEGFDARSEATLAKLMIEEEPLVKKKISVGLVFALVFAITAAVSATHALVEAPTAVAVAAMLATIPPSMLASFRLPKVTKAKITLSILSAKNFTPLLKIFVNPLAWFAPAKY